MKKISNNNKAKATFGKYGKQQDLETTAMIRFGLDGTMRIFFGDGIHPVYVPKDSAMYHSLKKQFESEEQ